MCSSDTLSVLPTKEHEHRIWTSLRCFRDLEASCRAGPFGGTCHFVRDRSKMKMRMGLVVCVMIAPGVTQAGHLDQMRSLLQDAKMFGFGNWRMLV